MSSRRFIVRCYKYHDPDLLSLFCTYDVSLGWLARKSLRAFVRHEPLLFFPRGRRDRPLPEKGWVYAFNFTLDTEKDADVLRFLDGVKRGVRCVAIKNIIRYSLYCPVTEGMLEDPEGLPELEACFEAHRESPRVTRAAGCRSRDPGRQGSPEERGTGRSPQEARRQEAPEKAGRTEPPAKEAGAGPEDLPENGIDMELLMGFSDMV